MLTQETHRSLPPCDSCTLRAKKNLKIFLKIITNNKFKRRRGNKDRDYWAGINKPGTSCSSGSGSGDTLLRLPEDSRKKIKMVGQWVQRV